jgi:hypothetical protein
MNLTILGRRHIQEPLWTLSTAALHVLYAWKEVDVESILHT